MKKKKLCNKIFNFEINGKQMNINIIYLFNINII